MHLGDIEHTNSISGCFDVGNSSYTDRNRATHNGKKCLLDGVGDDLIFTVKEIDNIPTIDSTSLDGYYLLKLSGFMFE